MLALVLTLHVVQHVTVNLLRTVIWWNSCSSDVSATLILSKHTLWAIFVYLSLPPPIHTHTHTNMLHQHPTDLPLRPPRSSSCPAICQIYNEAVVSHFLVQPLGLQARDCGGWHLSCVQFLLQCTDMLQHLFVCVSIYYYSRCYITYARQSFEHRRVKIFVWIVQNVVIDIEVHLCLKWYD